MWPFLLGRGCISRLPRRTTCWRCWGCARPHVPLSAILGSPALAVLTLLLPVVLAHSVAWNFLQAGQPYLWQVAALCWAWWACRGGAHRPAAGPAAARAGRTADGGAARGWISPLSPGFLGVVVLEALRARSPWVRTMGPLAVVGLVAVAVGQIHRAYQACKRAFGERFITGLHSSRRSLRSPTSARCSPLPGRREWPCRSFWGLRRWGRRGSPGRRARTRRPSSFSRWPRCPPSCWSSTSGRTSSPEGTSRLLSTGRSQRRCTARSCSATRSLQSDAFSSGLGPWGSWSPSCPAVRPMPALPLAPPGCRRRGSSGQRAAFCSAGTGPSMSRRHSRRAVHCSSQRGRPGPVPGSPGRAPAGPRGARPLRDGRGRWEPRAVRGAAAALGRSAAVGRWWAMVPAPRGARRPAPGAVAWPAALQPESAALNADPRARIWARLEPWAALLAAGCVRSVSPGGLARTRSTTPTPPSHPPDARARRRALHPLLPAAGPVRDVA